MILTLTVFLFLILLSGLFSASETAFTSLSIVQVEQLAAQKGRRGRMVKSLMQKPKILLTTILIGNNLANFGAAALATAFTIHYFGSATVGISTGILTLLVLIFAEVTPKNIAIENNEGIALSTAYPLMFLSFPLRPIIVFVYLVSSLVTQFFSNKENGKLSLDGLLQMMKTAKEMGLVADYENRMVRGVFRFNDVTVGAIMTHRTEVFSVNQSIAAREALKQILSTGFSRIPIYHRNPESITGIVLSKDIVKAVLEGQGEEPLKKFSLEPLFIPINRRINELFAVFKENTLNMAVILDEYGGLAGIVSREDVIEELMGELYDEHEPMDGEKITTVDEVSYRIQGDTSLHQVNDLLDLPPVRGKNALTIAGYIVEILGRIPMPGEAVSIPGATVEVEDVRKNRILTLLCRPEKKR